jgi:hypothetical protein
MDKSNIAFALITTLLGIYIAAALVLSRVSESRARKRDRPSAKSQRTNSWTSFSS